MQSEGKDFQSHMLDLFHPMRRHVQPHSSLYPENLPIQEPKTNPARSPNLFFLFSNFPKFARNYWHPSRTSTNDVSLLVDTLQIFQDVASTQHANSTRGPCIPTLGGPNLMELDALI